MLYSANCILKRKMLSLLINIIFCHKKSNLHSHVQFDLANKMNLLLSEKNPTPMPILHFIM
jgi:hypothetical protein